MTKVLLINTSEKSGGAAVACNRLMKALSKEGIAVKMLVRDKQTSDENVISVNSSWCKRKINKFRFLCERLIIWMHNGFSRKNLFAVSIANTGTDISKSPEVQEADIIHLHWINQGLLSLADIEKLIKLGKPIVWTMHDMWPCTAICHHARECTNYQKQCEQCPFLKYPRKNDISHHIFRKKQQLSYNKINFVTCSHWLKNQASISALFKDVYLQSIPNPLDISIFKPINRDISREQFNLPCDKYLILFGAAKISDPRKGGSHLFQALELLSNQYPDINNQIELVLVGNSTLSIPDSVHNKVHFMGYLSNENDIATLYSAVDIFIIPSLEENLPNTIMESMACGTPVVGFNIGGIPEMINHKINGYLANYKDSNDLMNGIYWILFNADYPTLSLNARNKIIEQYSEKVVAEQYIKLYHKLLES